MGKEVASKCTMDLTSAIADSLSVHHLYRVKSGTCVKSVITVNLLINRSVNTAVC